jgi:phage baseplate assembly protein W
MSTKTKTPIGLSLPIRRGPMGYFDQTFDVVEQVSNDLSILLNTKKGERRMNLDFGSSLWEVLFEFNDDNLQPIIEAAIRRDVAKWFPYVSITSVLVDSSSENRDKNLVNIRVLFTADILGITTPQVVNITAQQGNI